MVGHAEVIQSVRAFVAVNLIEVPVLRVLSGWSAIRK
jgi:hypothetical protein